MSNSNIHPATEVPILDQTRLLEEFGDDPEILAELQDLFEVSIPPLLEEIQFAEDAGDNETAAQTAHSLKGACSTYGALRLAELSRCVEMAAKQGELAAVAEIIRALPAELDQVLQAIAKLGGDD